MSDPMDGPTMLERLDAAVAAGVIDRATAQRLAPYFADAAPVPEASDPDDEKLRLITGFNDVFVTIGLVMFVGALGFLVSSAAGPVAGLVAVAAATWGLAEFFTRVRRLALPSIVLLVMFVAAVFLAVMIQVGLPAGDPRMPLIVAAIVTCGAALLHWLRFGVPITVAAGTAALVAIVLLLVGMAVPGILQANPVAVFLPTGLAVFALAMWFDSSDLGRRTRRTDIAFWLHLLAAPLIVHPILIPVMATTPSPAVAIRVLVVFVLVAVAALIIDRRAILVSSLTYLAYAAGTLIAAAGFQSSSFAVSILAVGGVVLLLSAAWRPLRRALMDRLPIALKRRLPAVA